MLYQDHMGNRGDLKSGDLQMSLGVLAMKVIAEVQNEPIGKRRKWQTRTRLQMLDDLKKELSAQTGSL